MSRSTDAIVEWLRQRLNVSAARGFVFGLSGGEPRAYTGHAPARVGGGAVDGRGEEREQFPERGEPHAFAGRQVLDATAEPPSAGCATRPQVDDERPLYRERRVLSTARSHGRFPSIDLRPAANNCRETEWRKRRAGVLGKPAEYSIGLNGRFRISLIGSRETR